GGHTSPARDESELDGARRPGFELGDDFFGCRDPAEFVGEVLEYRGLQVGGVGRYRIRDQRRTGAALEVFSRRLLHPDLRDGAGDQDGFDVAGLQEVVEVRVVEGAVAELVDDRIGGLGVELVNDVGAVELLVDVLVVAAEAFPAAADWGVTLLRPLPHRGPL